ncbi:MAG: biosynthetic-type acetolactate synthase large subunit [Candidatus Margulisiibacteriota bacterium]|nr:MAG: acetolactate synthase, large subunit, biosynthetic type [Candidatus Margulisbacteria bacterium GWD2_39_127]OGI05046.1 MAG: acetolactate synthase, large subunit, biosynthetic type [Candidatus Margulisbacteria bacterium GWF2_38_17]OGI11805.1 MAG: acetolactate synthase, large subunit, biosynthetic type [Candidatus Margulisbacteria bacterium GWE2_39_32]PZM79825.1 MAG: biosynthetic-type acetolactate synthase large subunit [Candidatus Margulisiibacteriota bacterium]HAR62733.1 biosynthetic-typ
MKYKGAKIFIESLKAENVEHIFGYPGGSVLEIYDELYDSDIKHYLVRHEQAAAHAADGYARSSGKVGVCLATSGPGATNLVTGIATAYMDSIPMVAFTGQVGTPFIGKDAFQEADMTGITLPITKHNYLVKDVEDLARTIKEAFYIARSGRPGPVLVDIPKDVTLLQADYNPEPEPNIQSYKPTYKGNPKQIKDAIALIQSSKKPVILAGGGVIASGASTELLEFAEMIQSPVAVTLMGLGSFPDTHTLSLKMPGMHGTAYANYSIYESDLILAIGMRFDDRITGKLSEFGKHAKIIHIDIDPAEIGKCVPVNVPIVGDIKSVLHDLISKIKEEALDLTENKKDWLSHVSGLKISYPLAYEYSADVIKPQFVVQEINKLIDDTAIITTEVGENQMWAAQYIDYTKPRTFASSGGLGTMGYGFPAAIGAQVANPGKLVIDIAGDGSIQMNIQELSTAAYYNLPVKIIILNNQHLGMVRQWQQLFYKERYSFTNLEGMQPDFVKLADAYGILGLYCDKPSEVRKTLEKAFSHNGPVIVDFRTARGENVFPMVPAGGVLNKMILEESKKGTYL